MRKILCIILFLLVVTQRFYAQKNKGYLKKAGGYSSRNVVLHITNNNKDEDNSPKNQKQNIIEYLL